MREARWGSVGSRTRRSGAGCGWHGVPLELLQTAPRAETTRLARAGVCCASAFPASRIAAATRFTSLYENFCIKHCDIPSGDEANAGPCNQTSNLEKLSKAAARLEFSEMARLASHRRFRDSSSSSVRGQSAPNSRDKLRSARTFPPVWQTAQ